MMFKLITTDGKARRGVFQTAHGAVQTPVFMNVGTQAAIKGGLSAEERPVIGQMANQIRAEIENELKEADAHIRQHMLEKKLASETIDVTLPGTPCPTGKEHPLDLVLNEVEDIFVGMGFSIAEGPEAISAELAPVLQNQFSVVCSCHTVLPPVTVLMHLPNTRLPAKGVLFPFEMKSEGSITYGVPISNTV